MNFKSKDYIKKLLSPLITKALTSIIKVGSVAVLIKQLGIENYGVYIIGMSIFLLAQTFSRIGIDLYIHQQSARFKNNILKINSLVGIILISGVISLIIMTLSTGFIKYYANGAAYDIWIYFVLTAPFYSICWNLTYLLRGLGKVTNSIILMELSLPSLQLLVYFIGEYYFSWGVVGASASLLISSVLSSFIFMSYFLHKTEFSINVNLETFYKSIKHSKRFLVVTVTSMLLVWSDTYFIGYYMLPRDVAIYNVITKLGMIILLPVSVITVYTNNFTSKWHKRKGTLTELKTQLTINISIVTVISVVVTGLLLLISPFVFEYFEISLTHEIYLTLILYLVAQCLFAFSGPIDSIFLMGTRQDVISKLNVVMVIINALLCTFLIPKYGLLGASMATIISVVLAKGTQLVLLNYIYKKVNK